jgi:hypothetical protein
MVPSGRGVRMSIPAQRIAEAVAATTAAATAAATANASATAAKSAATAIDQADSRLFFPFTPKASRNGVKGKIFEIARSKNRRRRLAPFWQVCHIKGTQA